MASVSTSHLIIFIASMLVAVSVAGTLTDTVGDVSSAIDDRSLDVSKDIRTEMEVISDPGSPVYNRDGQGNVTLLLKNTGSRDLPADADVVDVILDGRYRTAVTVTPIAGTAQWRRGDVVRVTIAAPDLPAGDHRASLVVGDDEEVFSFRT